MREQNITIKLLFSTLLFIGLSPSEVCAQKIRPFGGVITAECFDCNTTTHFPTYQFLATVYFDRMDSIPDSITFVGSNFQRTLGTQTQSLVCNGVIKVVYEPLVVQLSKSLTAHIKACFPGMQTAFRGGNFHDSVPFELQYFINTPMGGYIDNGFVPNELPLINLHKGLPFSFNALEKIDYEDSAYFYFDDDLPSIAGIKVNRKTGDVSHEGDLDTGFYTIVLFVNQGRYGEYVSTSRYYLTLHITDIASNSFEPISANLDSNYVPFIQVSKADTEFTYLCNYRSSKKISSYSVSAKSLASLNRPLQITSVKTDDSTLTISVKVFMDTGAYDIMKQLPKSILIHVSSTDIDGKCSETPHSFYLAEKISSSTGNDAQNENLSFTIFPNPANGIINLDLGKPTTEEVEFSVFDLTGKRILYETIEKGTQFHALNLDKLSSAMYFVQVSVNGISTARKFIKR